MSIETKTSASCTSELSLSFGLQQLSLESAPKKAPRKKTKSDKKAWEVMSSKIRKAGGIETLSEADFEKFMKEGRTYLHLDLGDLSVEEEDMEGIEEYCPNITSLVCGTIDDDTFKVVTRLTSLQSITLYDCSNLTNEDFSGIRNLAQLKFIKLMKCTQISSGLIYLKTFKKLEQIELDEVSVKAFVRSTQDFLELSSLQKYRIGKGRVIDLYNHHLQNVIQKKINRAIFWIQSTLLTTSIQIE
jgi:hypothetical protein